MTASQEPVGGRDVALVTGGSRGIGAAIVRQCLREGLAVCFTWARDERSARELVEELGPYADRLVAVHADVTDVTATRAAFDAAESLGRLTGLVNNAGTTGPIGRFADIVDEDVRRVVDVNLVAPVLLCREAVRRWSADPAGRAIVNVSSVAATLGAPHEYVPYAAAKAGVETLTVGLAKELAPLGIRVNAVAPGTTDTGIHAAAGEPGRAARVAPSIPMTRVGRPAEVAEAVTWLLSERSSYVTGAVVRVAGGL
ncbi:MAG TPA: SDR family oxidoreductase [Nocardioides sp.]|nr:SDR family oxidoreductase [Nocardioides sp.]